MILSATVSSSCTSIVLDKAELQGVQRGKTMDYGLAVSVLKASTLCAQPNPIPKKLTLYVPPFHFGGPLKSKMSHFQIGNQSNSS